MTRTGRRTAIDRAQANLLSLVVALVVLTTVTGLAIGHADGAIRGTDRDSIERTTASAVANQLVDADSPGTVRTNVIDGDRFDAALVEGVLPPDVDGRVSLDGSTVYERGTPDTGATVRRLVLVGKRGSRTIVANESRVDLSRRTPRVTVQIGPAADVRTVRSNERVLLHDPDGLEGEFDVEIDRYERASLYFDGDVGNESIAVTSYPLNSSSATLAVTVDG